MNKIAASELNDTICDVPGIKVGHIQNDEAKTGCTVILPEMPVVAGVDVRGLAPGTRELDLLDPVRQITEIHAIVLTGGSAFGLDAACGVVKFLEEHGIGFDTGVARIPIVPAAVIYDLAVGSPDIRPDQQMGYRAAQHASVANTDRGLVGAGTGATVGKFAGYSFAMNGGIGTCSVLIDDNIIIGALVVVNSLGNIINPGNGKTIAGARDPETMHFIDPIAFLKTPKNFSFARFTNTTLAVVATNARLSKADANKLARMATNGITTTTLPAHTPFDGDVVFAIATGEKPPVDLIRLGSLAAQLIACAIIQAVTCSNAIE